MSPGDRVEALVGDNKKREWRRGTYEGPAGAGWIRCSTMRFDDDGKSYTVPDDNMRPLDAVALLAELGT